MMQDVRIAAITMHSIPGQVRANLDRIHAWVRAARNNDVRLIVFPELNITGYTIDRNLAGSIAAPLNGPAVAEVAALSRRYDMTILAGLIERAAPGEQYATHLVFHDGEVSGRYRKTHIAPPEKSVFLPGNDLPVFHHHGLTFGIQLCYDSHFPEISTRMALQGADAVFIPHASPHGSPEAKLESWNRHLPARAFDNGMFVVACNQAGGGGARLFFPGAAVALAPSGEVIRQLAADGEGMLPVDLKADALRGVREHRMRYFLPDRRPELYVAGDEG